MIYHAALLVTTEDKKLAREVSKRAKDLGLDTTMTSEPIQKFYHVVVYPHGQPAGFQEGRLADWSRTVLTDWLKTQSALDWVEVVYGRQSYYPPKVTKSNTRGTDPTTLPTVGAGSPVKPTYRTTRR